MATLNAHAAQRLHSVLPGHIGQPALVAGAVVRAAPWGLGSKVVHAEPGGLLVRVGPALEMLAFLPHRHPLMVPPWRR